MATNELKHETLKIAHLIMETIEQKNDGLELEAKFSSGNSRYLEIRKKGCSVPILMFQGSTYYDLFRAVQCAWQAYIVMTVPCNW